MPRRCTICQHGERGAIEQGLREGLALRDIAGQYQVAKSSLHRHRRDHLPHDALAVRSEYSEGFAIPGHRATTPARTQEGRQPSQPAVQALDVELLKRSRVLLWKDKEERILAAFTDDKIQKMGGPQLAVAGGIATDKVRFWSGADKTESGVTVHVPASIRHSIALALKLTPADRPDGSPEEPGGKSR